MKNKCLQCGNYIHVQFEYGQEIKYCERLRIPLKDTVLQCTEFYSKNKVTQKLDEYQLWEFVNSIKPYIIEEKIEAGFKGEKNIIIRPATEKDKNEGG